MNLFKFLFFALLAGLAAAECFRAGTTFPGGRRGRVIVAKAAVRLCKALAGREIPPRRPVGFCRSTRRRGRGRGKGRRGRRGRGRKRVSLVIANAARTPQRLPGRDCAARLALAALKCRRGGGSADRKGFIFIADPGRGRCPRRRRRGGRGGGRGGRGPGPRINGTEPLGTVNRTDGFDFDESMFNLTQYGLDRENDFESELITRDLMDDAFVAAKDNRTVVNMDDLMSDMADEMVDTIEDIQDEELDGDEDEEDILQDGTEEASAVEKRDIIDDIENDPELASAINSEDFGQEQDVDVDDEDEESDGPEDAAGSEDVVEGADGADEEDDGEDEGGGAVEKRDEELQEEEPEEEHNKLEARGRRRRGRRRGKGFRFELECAARRPRRARGRGRRRGGRRRGGRRGRFGQGSRGRREGFVLPTQDRPGGIEVRADEPVA